MPLPQQIKIGPLPYKVHEAKNETVLEERPEGKMLNGEIAYHEGRIYVRVELPHDYKVVTLWHEVVHGMLDNAGHIADDGYEDVVTAISVAIVQVLRDNPDLIAYTLKAAEPTP